MVGIEFTHACLEYATPRHLITIAVDFPAPRSPTGAVQPPFINSVRFSFSSFGRISMKRRPRHRAALVRALPVFVCRNLFFCGAGKFPSAQALPIPEARDNTRGPSARIRHIPIHNEGNGCLFAPLRTIEVDECPLEYRIFKNSMNTQPHT